MGTAHDHGLGCESLLLEVAVRLVPFWVVGRDQSVLQVLREGVTPDEAVSEAVEVHPPHAHLGGVSSTQQAGVFVYQFRDVRGSVAQAGRQGREGRDVVPKGSRDADSPLSGLLQGQL